MINFKNIFSAAKDKRKCKTAILGANGTFGYTFISQCAMMEDLLSLRVVCDLDIQKSVDMLVSLGFRMDKICPCKTENDMKNAPADAIIVVDDASLVPSSDADVVVEATGNPEKSALFAEQCILAGKHVAMVSKEADVIAGPYLYKLSKKMGVVYTLAIGDQPANLINWLSYIESLGLEIICAGKSSEYDFVYDIDTGRFRYRDQEAVIPELAQYWHIGTDMRNTLENRSRLLSAYPQFAVPDYNEMNVVSNATGLVPSTPRLNYPLINVTELADVYALKEDGGLIEKPGVLDTFNCLHRFDEVSFAGGVFAIVKVEDKVLMDILKGKGHVVSSNGKYLALYLPYHFMGMEAPMSVLQAYYLNLSGYERCSNVSTMVVRAERDFHKGEIFSLHTHHRCINDVYVTLEPISSAPAGSAPYYLIAEKKLLKDVSAGSVITMDMVDFSGSDLKRMIDSEKNF